MVWGLEQWEIEVQTPVFNRGHVHTKVLAALFLTVKSGSNPNALFGGGE